MVKKFSNGTAKLVLGSIEILKSINKVLIY